MPRNGIEISTDIKCYIDSNSRFQSKANETKFRRLDEFNTCDCRQRPSIASMNWVIDNDQSRTDKKSERKKGIYCLFADDCIATGIKSEWNSEPTLDDLALATHVSCQYFVTDQLRRRDSLRLLLGTYSTDGHDSLGSSPSKSPSESPSASPSESPSELQLAFRYDLTYIKHIIYHFFVAVPSDTNMKPRVLEPWVNKTTC